MDYTYAIPSALLDIDFPIKDQISQRYSPPHDLSCIVAIYGSYGTYDGR